jgi:glucan 1,3-beta-glucosidase
LNFKTQQQIARWFPCNQQQLINMPITVGVLNGTAVLAGGTKPIESWGQGNVYAGSNPNGQLVLGDIPQPIKAPCLLYDSGRIVSPDLFRYFGEWSILLKTT